MAKRHLYCKSCQGLVWATSVDAHRRAVHQSAANCVYPDGARALIPRNAETQKWHCERCNFFTVKSRDISTHTSGCHALATAPELDEDDAGRPSDFDPQEDGFGPLLSQPPPFPTRSKRCLPTLPSTLPPPVSSTPHSENNRRSHSSPGPSFAERAPAGEVPSFLRSAFATRPSHDPLPRSNPQQPESHLPASSPPSPSHFNDMLRSSSPSFPEPQDARLSQEVPVASSRASSPFSAPIDLSDPPNHEDADAALEPQEDPHPSMQSSIAPGPETVVTADFQRWGIVVNTTHRVVICVGCKCCVAPVHLTTHLRSHGHVTVKDAAVTTALSPYDLVQTRESFVPALSANAFPSAVFGLNIVDSYFCSRCHRGYGSEYSLTKNHFSKTSCNPARSYYRCPGQTFFTNNRRRVFPVTLPSLPSQPDSATPFDLYLRAVIPPDPSAEPIAAPANERSLSRFIAKEKWLSHVLGLQPSFIHSLVDIQDGDSDAAAVRACALSYLEKVVSALETTPPQIKRRMAQFSDDPSSGAFIPLSRPSLLQYSRYLAQLLLFALRVLELPDEPYHVPLTEYQRVACRSLADALAGLLSDTSLQTLVHDVLYSLVAHSSPSSTIDRYFSPITRFQVLSAVATDGDFIKTNDIRRLNAQLIYIMRATMFTEILSRIQSQDSNFYPVYTQLRTYLISDAETPYAYSAALAGILHAMENQDDSMARVQFKDVECTTILHEDIEFTHSSIASVVRGAMAEFDAILSSKLLCGIPQDDPAFTLPELISSIYDQPRNFDADFNFFDDPRNKMGDVQHALLRLILNNSDLAGSFHYVHGDQVVWKSLRCQQFLRDAYEAEQRLCTMIHLSYGQPARGEELATVTVRNIRGGSARNLYVMHGFLVILTGYWKCADQTGRDKIIVRVPAPEVAQRLLFYLAFVRPVQIAFAKVFYDEAVVQRFTHYLFPGLHRPLGGQDVSACLRADTAMYLRCEIGLRDHRQLVSALSRYARPVDYSDDTTHPYELQRGHRRRVYDSHYGISNGMLPGEDPQRVIAQICASTYFHFEIGMGKKYDPNGKGSYTIVPAADAPTASAAPAIDPEAFADQIAARLLPYLGRHLPGPITSGVLPTLERSMHRIAAVLTLDHRPSAVTVTPASTSQYAVTSGVLKALRDFLKDNTASFSSPLQGQALVAYLSRKVNMLVCLPTGHGKSLLFFLPAKMYESERTTVVIVPLLSLHADFTRRAGEHGIRTRRWQPSDTLESCFVPLVLVSPEHLNTKPFVDFINQLHQNQRLLRLVFDEAHLMITQASFRECFDDMRHLREVGVPFILLTATLAPHLETPLFHKLNVSDIVVFRLPSVRPEISIQLKSFRTKAAMNDAFIPEVKDSILRLEPHERGLIFCKTVAEVEIVARQLGVDAFHSKLEPDTKTMLLRQFVRGDLQVLVSTSVLGEGLDLSSIRFVFHWGLPRDPSSYYQESGRMCRDRRFGTSAVYFLQSEQVRVADPDTIGAGVIKTWCNEDDICRRIRLAEFLDGAPTQCSVLINPNLCDVCAREMDNPNPPPLAMFPDPIVAPHDFSNVDFPDVPLPQSPTFEITHEDLPDAYNFLAPEAPSVLPTFHSPTNQLDDQISPSPSPRGVVQRRAVQEEQSLRGDIGITPHDELLTVPAPPRDPAPRTPHAKSRDDMQMVLVPEYISKSRLTSSLVPLRRSRDDYGGDVHEFERSPSPGFEDRMMSHTVWQPFGDFTHLPTPTTTKRRRVHFDQTPAPSPVISPTQSFVDRARPNARHSTRQSPPMLTARSFNSLATPGSSSSASRGSATTRTPSLPSTSLPSQVSGRPSMRPSAPTIRYSSASYNAPSTSRRPLEPSLTRRQLPGVETSGLDDSSNSVGTRVTLDSMRATAEQDVLKSIARNVDDVLSHFLFNKCSKCAVRALPYDHASTSCPDRLCSATDTVWQKFKEQFLAQRNKATHFGWHGPGSPTDCEFFDIIKPALYVVFADRNCRRLYSKDHGHELPQTVETFMSWLAQTEDKLGNQIRLFHWICTARGLITNFVGHMVYVRLHESSQPLSAPLRVSPLVYIYILSMQSTTPVVRSQTGRLDNIWYFTDAICAARLDDTRWISTPNAEWIPAISTDKVEVRGRRDGWYGSADPHRWPQLFDSKFTHLCILPDPFYPGSSEMPASVMDNVMSDHYRFTSTVGENDERLVVVHYDRSPILARDLEDLKNQMEVFIREDAATSDFTGGIPPNIHAPLKNYVLSAFDAVERMKSVPMTLQQFVWENREYQRYYSEATAYMEFARTFTHRMVDARRHSADTRLMGAISDDPVIVQRLFRAGIPVWFIRPYRHLLPELKITDVVDLVQPEERQVTLQEYDPSYPTYYSGPPGRVHLTATHLFGRFQYTPGIPDAPPLLPQAASGSGSRRRPLSPDPETATSLTPPKKGKSSHTAPPPTDAKHTPPKAKAGRDHFVDPEHPLIPPPISQWANTLTRVQNDPTRLQRDRIPGGYYCPNPASFATASSLTRFLETWLTIRPAWLAHMKKVVYTAAVVPFNKQVWNALLVMTDEQRRSAASQHDATSKLSASAKARMEAMSAFGQFFPTSDFRTPSSVRWHEFSVATPIRNPAPSFVRQVVWELYELSFRLELSAVDFKLSGMASKPPVLRNDRLALLSACFADRQLVPTHYPQSNVGLASLHRQNLAVFVECLRRVVLHWPNSHSMQRHLRPEDHPQLVVEIEHDVVSFYCQTFYDVTGRAAVVPHRLPSA
ncbi:uncharacterized protein B0H18DRAFT_956901 [Fomitopsis serialis]|uniref:uncharacterized protein n=1 Tax=Fomitopsis serialis TaxID=139415 RepID=UPI002008A074|nr:uncharacterized protein B0H18DRAFT_956901 [Neoantrodia serialis]KAH9920765.1 hypothetical protein B0H18DRAFT_956901 [Neoantrodia serialis]